MELGRGKENVQEPEEKNECADEDTRNNQNPSLARSSALAPWPHLLTSSRTCGAPGEARSGHSDEGRGPKSHVPQHVEFERKGDEKTARSSRKKRESKRGHKFRRRAKASSEQKRTAMPNRIIFLGFSR